MLSCEALFISDLHLGSNQCEAGHLAAFLECIRPRQLFLVGDIIDLQAIRFNANVDADFLTDLIDSLLAREDDPIPSPTRPCSRPSCFGPHTGGCWNGSRACTGTG